MKKFYQRTALFLSLLLLTGTAGTDFSANAKTAKISLNRKKLSLTTGKKFTLKVKGTKKKAKWKSSKPKIAKVNKKGVVTAKKKGTAKITARVAGKKLSCTVLVKKAKSTNTSAYNSSSPSGMASTAPAETGNNSSASPAPSAASTDSPADTAPAPSAASTAASTDAAPPVPDGLTVTFSKESGSYMDEFDLMMAAPEGCTIYYTTDGSIPLSNEDRAETGITFPQKLPTEKYQTPIHITDTDSEPNHLWTQDNYKLMFLPSENFDGAKGASDPDTPVPKATVIRAIAVSADGRRSNVVTKTYFVGKNLSELYHGAAVASIVTDPDNLLEKETGIYRHENWKNTGKNWERPADIVYIDEDGTIPFETTMGLRINGGYSRRFGQKSLRMYFRDELGGMKNLKGYELIPGATNHDGTAKTTTFKNFVFRNGGNDYKYTKMADAWIQSLVRNRAVATQETRPAVVYLNGEYWGLYNLTERYSDNYLETEFGVKKNNVISFKESEWQEGQDEAADTEKYNELMALAELDMTKSENYEKFKHVVDIESFTDYFAIEAYIANKDWPVEDNKMKNIQIWRSSTTDETNPYADGKWRYMLYDTEYSMNLWGSDESWGGGWFGDDENSNWGFPGGDNTNPIVRAQKDKLFKAVSANKEFQKLFAATVMSLADNEFEPNKAAQKWSKMEAVYRPLMEQYFTRWGSNSGGFDSETDRVEWLKTRKSKMEKFLKKSFGDDILS